VNAKRSPGPDIPRLKRIILEFCGIFTLVDQGPEEGRDERMREFMRTASQALAPDNEAAKTLVLTVLDEMRADVARVMATFPNASPPHDPRTKPSP
jgi:hypothetical protein